MRVFLRVWALVSLLLSANFMLFVPDRDGIDEGARAAAYLALFFALMAAADLKERARER